MRREYIEKITKGQKGRAHPEKQVPWFDDCSWASMEFQPTACQIPRVLCFQRIQINVLFLLGWIWQFRNDPNMRLYKIFQHTERKSLTGLIDIWEACHLCIVMKHIDLATKPQSRRLHLNRFFLEHVHVTLVKVSIVISNKRDPFQFNSIFIVLWRWYTECGYHEAHQDCSPRSWWGKWGRRGWRGQFCPVWRDEESSCGMFWCHDATWEIQEEAWWRWWQWWWRWWKWWNEKAEKEEVAEGSCKPKTYDPAGRAW